MYPSQIRLQASEGRSVIMRVVVTGGLGFLGRYTVRALRTAGHDVLALDIEGEPLEGVETALADIADADAVARVFRAFAPESVVHLAALLTPASQNNVVAATRVNALGTAVVFAAALASDVSRIVYASSVAALGSADPSRGDATIPAPIGIYGATKAFSEHLARALAPHQTPTLFIGLRFGWVYGPGRDRGWRELQAIIEAAVRGEPRIVYPDLPDPIDWTWVEDAAEVVIRSVTAPLEDHAVFNVAGDRRRVGEMVEHLRSHFSKSVFAPEPAPAQPASWAFANDGLEQALSYVPMTSMEAGVDKLIASLRSMRT